MVAQPTGQLGLALLLGLKAISHRNEIPVLLQVQLPDIRLLRGGRWGGERGEGRGERGGEGRGGRGEGGGEGRGGG